MNLVYFLDVVPRIHCSFQSFSSTFLADPILQANLNFLNVGFNNLASLPREILGKCASIIFLVYFLEQNTTWQNNITTILLNVNNITGTFPTYYFSPTIHFVGVL